MELDRKASKINAANKIKNDYDNKYHFFEGELEIRQPACVIKPKISNIKERAQADHEEARVAGGLYAQTQPINPDRECMVPSLGYVEKPVFQTRSQMKATRRDVMRRDSEANRLLGAHTFIPPDVRVGLREQEAYEYRRDQGNTPGDTLTKLKADRKRERIEYDMHHFGLHEKQLPRWSDLQEPWYVKTAEASGSDAYSRTYPTPKMVKEADYKVTQVSKTGRYWAKPALDSGRPAADQNVQTSNHHWSEQVRKTIPSWTTQQLAFRTAGNGRIFDNIPPQRCYQKDLMHIDSYSSFDLIRQRGLRKSAETKQHAENSPTELNLEPLRIFIKQILKFKIMYHK